MQINIASILQSLKSLKFPKRKQEVIGIDIGSYAIKLVYLKKSAGKWSLIRWGMIPYGEDIPLDTALADRSPQAVTALQTYLKTADFPVKKAATSISGNSVIVRYVKMARMPAEELLKSLKFEAEPYIPFNIEDVNLSFSILGDVVEEGQPQMETVLVAAKKESVDLRVDLLKEAGLQPAILDIDAFAIENVYEQIAPPPQTDTVLVMNLGASLTNMSIIEKGLSKVVRDVFIGGNSFTKALQRQFQCDVKTAEQKKFTYGLIEDSPEPEAQQVSEVLAPVARDLLVEIQRSIDFYVSQGTDRTINKILLCGGTANLKMLDQYLNRELKVPVEIFNPFSFVQNPPVDLSDEQRSLLPQMAIAAGLAVRYAGDTPA